MAAFATSGCETAATMPASTATISAGPTTPLISCRDSAIYADLLARANTQYRNHADPHDDALSLSGKSAEQSLKIIKQYLPYYPLRMASSDADGICIMVYSLSPDAVITDLEIACSDPAFEQPSKRALGRFEFEPAKINGSPTWATSIVQPIKFCMAEYLAPVEIKPLNE